MTPPGYDVVNVPCGGGDPHGRIAVLYQKKVLMLFPNQTILIATSLALSTVPSFLFVDPNV